MKYLYTTGVLCSLCVLLLIQGCEMIPNPGDSRKSASGRDLVINEVFMIPPDRHYAFSWIEIYNPTNRTIKWTDSTKPATGTVVGGGGSVIRTTNSGTPWFDSGSNSWEGASGEVLYDISLANPDTGFAVGENGTILKVSKSGATKQNSGVNVTLRGVVATPDAQNRTAFAVGDQGTVLRTIDRGVSWQLPNPAIPHRQTLRSVTFLPQLSTTFIVGDSGLVLKSTNLGNRWFRKNVPEPVRDVNFHGVSFFGLRGIIVGSNGTVITTADSGAIWTQETTKVSVTLRNVFLAPSNSREFEPGRAWAVGDSGTAITSSDFGRKWQKLHTGVGNKLNAVRFVDSLRGWIYGDADLSGGLILATTDGGKTWNRQSTDVSHNIHSGWFPDLLVIESSTYVMLMYSKRDQIFFDRSTGTINPDFTQPLPDAYVPFVAFNTAIRPSTFLIVTNDSIRFSDHTNKETPGGVTGIRKVFNWSISAEIDSGAPGGTFFPFRLFKWALLPSSEIILIRVFERSLISTGQPIGSTSVEIIDVVRYGNYRPTPDVFSHNEPQGSIPEWWSMARFKDMLDVDPLTQSTKATFYMSNSPIPGWYSLRGSQR